MPLLGYHVRQIDWNIDDDSNLMGEVEMSTISFIERMVVMTSSPFIPIHGLDTPFRKSTSFRISVDIKYLQRLTVIIPRMGAV
jgi:hypothetical protein